MQSQILDDDDCACLLVEAIAKHSQNIKWTTKVDGKNVQHRLIRRVSIDQFYALVTSEKDAFYNMCMELPNVIERVVYAGENIKMPQDTVMPELYKISELFKEEVVESSMAMAVYMLGFSSYLGFDRSVEIENGEKGELSLKHLYEYVRKMKNKELI